MCQDYGINSRNAHPVLIELEQVLFVSCECEELSQETKLGSSQSTKYPWRLDFRALIRNEYLNSCIWLFFLFWL